MEFLSLIIAFAGAGAHMRQLLGLSSKDHFSNSDATLFTDCDTPLLGSTW